MRQACVVEELSVVPVCPLLCIPMRNPGFGITVTTISLYFQLILLTGIGLERGVCCGWGSVIMTTIIPVLANHADRNL